MIYYVQTGEAAKNFRPRYGRRMQIPVLLMNHIIIVCLKYGALTRIFAVKLFCHTHIWESNASFWLGVEEMSYKNWEIFLQKLQI